MGAHGAADEDGLAGQLVVHGDEGVVSRERARAALAVHQQLLGHAVDQMLLHLLTLTPIRMLTPRQTLMSNFLCSTLDRF